MRALCKKYKARIKKFLFVFVINYNDRSCVLDSDSYFLYPHVNSKRDSCMKFTQQLRQCDQGSEFDISLNDIVPQYPLNFSCRLIMAISPFPTFITRETQ